MGELSDDLVIQRLDHANLEKAHRHVADLAIGVVQVGQRLIEILPGFACRYDPDLRLFRPVDPVQPICMGVRQNLAQLDVLQHAFLILHRGECCLEIHVRPVMVGDHDFRAVRRDIDRSAAFNHIGDQFHPRQCA